MKVIASWDDAAVWDIRIAELMKKYSIPTIFYWPVNLEKSINVSRVGKFLTRNQCEEIAKEFEIGSHTVTHSFLTKIPLQSANHEIKESRKNLQEWLNQPINSFCYPRGYANTIIRMIVKNCGYTNARNVIVGNLGESEDPIWTTPTVHVGIDRIEYKNICWQMYAKQMLEVAKTKDDAIYHLFGHSWEIERENDWHDLEELLKELTT